MVALVPAEVLERPPSREDGIDAATEDQLRRFGADLIQRAGVLLRLPQLTVVSAAAMFQRFYFRKSFAEFEVRSLATAALALASKLEERPRKLHDVIQVFYRLQMRVVKEDDGVLSYEDRPTPALDPSQREFQDVKNEVVRAERNILRELGFEVALLLDHPHRYVLEYLEYLNRPAKLKQKAWSYLNDSLQTSLCCSHQPNEIAAASLFLAARSLKMKLPSKPPWWEVLGTHLKDAKQIALRILALYTKARAEHIAVPRRKRELPETPAGPMTPFPETPAPMKSPSDEDDRQEPAGGDAIAPPTEENGLDQGRIAEMLAERDGLEPTADVQPTAAAGGFDKPERGGKRGGESTGKRDRERDRGGKDRRRGRERRGRGGSSGSSRQSRSRSAPAGGRRVAVKQARHNTAKELRGRKRSSSGSSDSASSERKQSRK
eukprot:TRINITY_DN63963_c0_g1_i1.p1 TRINITY_DN63963_c0_g1~~TRINITY_DN63963_c0_g1_i1.p1  ORF type:complete len:434 (-),score=93.79 TRINITY_DN63963_c0_g1_i1:34-1335(-)